MSSFMRTLAAGSLTALMALTPFAALADGMMGYTTYNNSNFPHQYYWCGSGYSSSPCQNNQYGNRMMYQMPNQGYYAYQYQYQSPFYQYQYQSISPTNMMSYSYPMMYYYPMPYYRPMNYSYGNNSGIQYNIGSYGSYGNNSGIQYNVGGMNNGSGMYGYW